MPYHVRVYTCVLFVCVRVRTHVYVHANTLRHRSIGRHKQKSRFKRNKTIVNQDLWYLFCYVDILKQKLNNTCVCACARILVIPTTTTREGLGKGLTVRFGK